MSKLDIINDEIARREANNQDLLATQQELEIAIEQFNKLDELYRTDEKASREDLECFYLENRHFTAKWPIVYSFSDTEFYPYTQGETDDLCNPYFPITRVKDGTFDGIEPLFAEPTRTGDFGRDRDYTTPEPPLRDAAIIALQAYPDNSDETASSGSCSDPQYADQATCELNGETWTPGYGPGDTATEKLRAALDPWRAEIVAVQTDLCNDDGTEAAFWQDILDNVDDVLAAIQTDVTYPAQTQDFTPGSPEDLARDYLIANDSTFETHVNNRSTFLSGEATLEEDVFFGIIKLRLHQANGSFSKLKAAKDDEGLRESLIADNNSAIESLNVLKVKNS